MVRQPTRALGGRDTLNASPKSEWFTMLEPPRRFGFVQMEVRCDADLLREPGNQG